MNPKAQQSDALHARVQAFIRKQSDDSYESLALAIAQFQMASVEGYGRLCRVRGADARLASFPAVPTDAFKLTRVSAFSPHETKVVFRTSGTTIGARGEHLFRHTSTYDLGALTFGADHLGLSKVSRFPVLVVGPSQAELPDSSLTHMLALFVDTWGTVDRTQAFFLQDGALQIDRLTQVVSQLDQPVLLCGTSFAFVHLIDELNDRRIALPKGSRLMQTGGFKGRSRVVDAAELKRLLSNKFSLEPGSVMSEYGMTELSSQFYEVGVSERGFPVYAEPHWTRVVAVDPMTLEPVPVGEEGIARIEDLANVDSAWAVLVPDRIRRVASGFELLGRSEGATPRGCSIAIDEILGSGR